MANIHIIGTGLAGLAAGATLARAGHYVQLYEATQHAGGRCSLLRDELRNDGYDGCNALMFGGSKEVIRFAEQIGSQHSLMLLDAAGLYFDTQQNTHRKRTAFLMPPALPVIDVLKLLGLKAAGGTVREVFDYYHPLSADYVEPLCRGLTLSEPDQASASLLAKRTLRLMRQGRKAWRVMVPAHSLYHSLVEPALRQIEHENGSIYYNHALKKLSVREGRIHCLHFAKQVKELREQDRVILALPAHVLQTLAPDVLPATLGVRTVLQVHFHTGEDAPSRVVPLVGNEADWVRQHRGVVSVIAYAPERLLNLHDDTIARRLWPVARAALGHTHGEDLPTFRVVRSRRAHLVGADTGNLQPLKNAVLAGEVFGPKELLPLEAAIASGNKAAELVLKSL